MLTWIDGTLTATGDIPAERQAAGVPQRPDEPDPPRLVDPTRSISGQTPWRR